MVAGTCTFMSVTIGVVESAGGTAAIIPNAFIISEPANKAKSQMKVYIIKARKTVINKFASERMNNLYTRNRPMVKECE